MKRHVLHVIDHLGPGGAQTVILNLLKYRDSARFDYTVACLHGRGQMAAELEALGLRVISLSAAKWPPGYLWSLVRLFRRECFAIAHFHLFGANWIAKPIACLMGCKVLISHDHCNDALREKGLFLALDRLTNRLSTRILAVSQSVVRFLTDREKLTSHQVEYFPNGADVRGFPAPSPVLRAESRGRWNLPEDAFLIGGVGRLVAQKDFHTFLEIAALVHQANPAVRFVIFGDGPQEAELKAKAVAAGLGGVLTFAGYVTGRAAIYGAIDLLLLTSRFEGTPMVLLEAMIAQVPIVATGVDGTAEILQEGESALFFPTGEAKAGAMAVLALLADPARRDRLVNQARRDVVERFNAEAQMGRLEALYEALLRS